MTLGFFGAHHFYLSPTSLCRSRFPWIWAVTSLVSAGTSVLMYWYVLPWLELSSTTIVDNAALTLVLRLLIVGVPVATPMLRWLLDVERLPRLVARANAPVSLLNRSLQLR